MAALVQLAARSASMAVKGPAASHLLGPRWPICYTGGPRCGGASSAIMRIAFPPEFPRRFPLPGFLSGIPTGESAFVPTGIPDKLLGGPIDAGQLAQPTVLTAARDGYPAAYGIGRLEAARRTIPCGTVSVLFGCCPGGPTRQSRMAFPSGTGRTSFWAHFRHPEPRRGSSAEPSICSGPWWSAAVDAGARDRAKWRG